MYSGHSNKHILGVGLCLNLPVAKALTGWDPVSEQIITARFQTRHAKVTIIQTHPPTIEADDNKKDNFYNILQNVIDEIPQHDIKLLWETSVRKLINLVKAWNLLQAPMDLLTLQTTVVNDSHCSAALMIFALVTLSSSIKTFIKLHGYLLTITQRMKSIIFL